MCVKMEHRYASSFGDLLKLFRKRKGLSQQLLAERLQVHRNTIGVWERGDRLPDTRGMVLEIAQRLELGDDDTLQLLEASLTALAPHWYVPHPRNPSFTGRDEVLQEIHAWLHNDPAGATGLSFCLLSGPGGIGKTQTALEYAYRHHYDYSALFWMSAATYETLVASCAAIADQLPYMRQFTQNQSQLVATVKQWLREHRGWLLILDNVEDPALIQDFLLMVRNGSLLLTSRQPALGGRVPAIPLQPMWAEEGAFFLLRRTRYLVSHTSDDRARARTFALAQRIAAMMDGLPLALDQAGAYIEETQCNLADFLSLLQRHPIALLEARDSHADHPVSVSQTFTLAYEQLCREHRAAADLLTLCCFFAPEQIPEEGIRRGAPHLDPPLSGVVADALQFNAALCPLLTYALLQRNPETKTLSMHRLVQMVLRHHLDASARSSWARRALRLVSASILSTPAGMWTTCEQLLPHALTMLHCLEEEQGTEAWDADCASEVAALQMKLAGYLAAQGHYTQAAALSGRSHRLYELYPTAMRPEWTRSLLYLADLYAQQGKDCEARTCYERAHAIQEQVLGPQHPQVIATLLGLALLYKKQQRYEQAIALLLPIVAKPQNGSIDPAFQTLLLNSLADLYARQEAYAEAEDYFQRALTLWRETQSPA
jgi:transcriptional regulator with XRE-family HTH domain/Tfp pilus assembly protein PilF